MLTALVAALFLQADYRLHFPLPGRGFGDGWGVNIHFTHPQPGEMDRLRQAGFKWVRMDFVWSAIERTRGSYDFGSYDELTRALDGAGVRPIFILDYGNDLYEKGSPRSPEARAGFCRFVEAAMKHFRGRGIVWEMWNEPNISFWRPKPNVNEYIALAEDVGKTIRRVAPEEYFVGPATSGFDWGFLESCFKAGLLGYWDAVTVHPYRSSEPETVGPDWARLQALVERYKPKGKSVPTISGEWGYSDVNLKEGAEQQGRFAVRQYLSNLSAGVNLSIWYDWKNDGPDPKEPEHHFGTQFSDLRSKPAYEAIAGLNRELAGYRVLGATFDGLALVKDSKVARVSWSRGLDGAPKIAYESGSSYPYNEAIAKPWLPPVILFESRYDLGQLLERYLGPWETNCSVLAVDGQTISSETVGPGGYVHLPGVQMHDGRTLLIRLRRKDGVEQQAIGLCTKPISLRFVAAPPGKVRVAIENPGGLRLSATMVVTWGKGGMLYAPFDLKEGDAYKIIDLPEGVVGDLPGLKASIVKPAAHRGTLYDEYGPVTARSLWPSLSEAVSEWTADGDAKIGAKVSRSVEKALPGSGFDQAFRLDYEFALGWKFACLRPLGDIGKPLPGKPSEFGFWLYGDGGGQMLRMRFQDSTGQAFQPDYGVVDWKGWRYVTLPLDGRAGGRWGGANDGVIHWPIRIETALLLDSAGKGGKGTVYATGFTVFSRD